jgi:hypothetical protein
MVKRTWVIVAATFVTAATLAAGMLVATGTVTAQDTSGTPGAATGLVAHPAHIHTGTCDQLGDIEFPLNDLTAPSAGSPTAATPVTSMESPVAGEEVVAQSITEVNTTLNELLGDEHAINVHESAENIQNYIACGDITGTATNDLLEIELRELNASGFKGKATLKDNGDNTVTVTVTLMTSERMAGSPVATPAG